MDSARGPFFTADEDDEFEAVAAVEYMVDGFIPDNDTRTGQSYILDHSYSHRSVSIMGPPPITGRFYYHQRFEDPRPRFLDSCALCKKPLGSNRDIFMYRLVSRISDIFVGLLLMFLYSFLSLWLEKVIMELVGLS
ncbi:hypothetical protein SAY86_012680 [Trapa natans]|uniref:FLZ-type domain-containing protein n=1 Tax=Trapa natans TaxID=22666 RepID=A0AAN7RBS8_TRANT|nr:hypothetical protein SAY86_012680 [Trapa natans]